MNIARHVEAFRRDLLNVAGVGAAEETALVRRLADALESSVRLRVLELLADAARELEAQLTDASIDVRFEEGEPELVLREEESAERPPDDELSARITLRLPEGLKKRIEEAADDAGVSVNTWLVRELDRSVDRLRTRRRPGRVTGYARS